MNAVTGDLTDGRTEDPADVTGDIDVYDRVTRPAAGSEEFADTNFGLGNYQSEDELYAQVQSFREAKYGKAAFERAITLRAVREAKRQFLREEYRTKAEHTSRDFAEWVEDNEDRWHDLDVEEQRQKVRKYAGVTLPWKPPQLKTAEMRLEVSRGRDARLMDNVFGRVVERITEGAEAAKEALAELGGTSR